MGVKYIPISRAILPRVLSAASLCGAEECESQQETSGNKDTRLNTTRDEGRRHSISRGTTNRPRTREENLERLATDIKPRSYLVQLDTRKKPGHCQVRCCVETDSVNTSFSKGASQTALSSLPPVPPWCHRPSILPIILSSQLYAHSATHVARAFNTNIPLAEAQNLKMKKQQTPRSWNTHKLAACGTGYEYEHSQCPADTPLFVLVLSNTRGVRPFDAPHASEDVLGRARSQNAMRLATLLDALLLRYLCVPLAALPPPPMRYKLLQENVTALRTAALPRARKSSSSSLLSSPPEPLYLSIAQDESAQLRRAVRMLRPLWRNWRVTYGFLSGAACGAYIIHPGEHAPAAGKREIVLSAAGEWRLGVRNGGWDSIRTATPADSRRVGRPTACGSSSSTQPHDGSLCGDQAVALAWLLHFCHFLFPFYVYRLFISLFAGRKPQDLDDEGRGSGTPRPQGMIPRAVAQLCRVADDLRDKGWAYRFEGHFVFTEPVVPRYFRSIQ
ncbi:hypothetical protein C8J57DRAFT_1229839 [Mycena rebaudengoi]|nr:hypothetical protein C8J57DRAFT_1229839 [Mycena rebaudengoi]